MATLNPYNLIDQPNCLLTAWCTDPTFEGAIGRMDVTARMGDVDVYAIYKGNTVTRTVPAGTTQTVTFAGNSAKTGDVQAVGCNGGWL